MSNREQIVVEKIGNFFIEAEITDLQDLSGTVQGILDELKNGNNMELFKEQTGLNDDDIKLITAKSDFIRPLRNYILSNQDIDRQIKTGGTRRKRRSKKSRKSKKNTRRKKRT
jgi:hypothetical protein